MGVKIRRLIAIYIDYNITFYICYFFGKIISLLISENLFLEIIFSIISFIIWFNLFLRKDTLFGYESIGKKLMRLKIYDLSNNELVKNKKRLIDRNFYSFWSLPIYAFMILINNQSVGDKEMKTMVK